MRLFALIDRTLDSARVCVIPKLQHGRCESIRMDEIIFLVWAALIAHTSSGELFFAHVPIDKNGP